jgi:carbonic anhydrase/acetyltransferase-like protein (isoleucine patch superfamily)
MIIELGEKKPRIGNNVFIAPTAVIVGDVEIRDGASIWYGAVLRGDMAPIFVGENSNIQDNCTVHTDYGKPTHIGKHVTVGHNVVVHGCYIEDYCLIGMGSLLLNECRVLTGSMVAAGSLLKERQVVGPFHLVAGAPATLRKEFPHEIIPKIADPIQNYLDAAHEHMTFSRIRNEGG